MTDKVYTVVCLNKGDYPEIKEWMWKNTGMMSVYPGIIVAQMNEECRTYLMLKYPNIYIRELESRRK